MVAWLAIFVREAADSVGLVFLGEHLRYNRYWCVVAVFRNELEDVRYSMQPARKRCALPVEPASGKRSTGTATHANSRKSTQESTQLRGTSCGSWDLDVPIQLLRRQMPFLFLV